LTPKPVDFKLHRVFGRRKFKGLGLLPGPHNFSHGHHDGAHDEGHASDLMGL